MQNSVINRKIDTSKALSAYFEKLSRIETTEKINEIVIACKVERHTFYNWKRGVCRMPKLYQDKVEEVLGEKIFKRYSNL